MNFLQQPGFTDVLNGKIFLGPLQNRFRGFCRLATLKQQITKKQQHLTNQLQDIKNCCSSALKTAYFRATQIRKHYFGNFKLIIFVIVAITQSQLGKIQQIFFIFLLTYLFAVCYVPFFFAKCFLLMRQSGQKSQILYEHYIFSDLFFQKSDLILDIKFWYF